MIWQLSTEKTYANCCMKGGPRKNSLLFTGLADFKNKLRMSEGMRRIYQKGECTSRFVPDAFIDLLAKLIV